MSSVRFTRLLALIVAVTFVTASQAADSLDKQGKPDLQSAGALAFAPDGILLVGDARGAALFAIDTGDRTRSDAQGSFTVNNIVAQIASLLGTKAPNIIVNDVAVNPASGKAYLSVSRGRGPDAIPVLLRVDRKGKLELVSLSNVKYAKASLPNAPASKKSRRGDPRDSSITDIAYLDGEVIVAGLSNEEFASNLRTLSFPFTSADRGTSIEIYHGAHGRLETRSPIRTFSSLDIDGESYLLAAYTCTPLVKIPVAQLKPESKVRGTTIAELGNHNRPLDMIVYNKDGKDFVLMANSAHGLIKVSTEGIADIDAITQRIPDKAGLGYETLAQHKGVIHLDRLSSTEALLVVKNEDGLSLQSIELP